MGNNFEWYACTVDKGIPYLTVKKKLYTTIEASFETKKNAN